MAVMIISRAIIYPGDHLPWAITYRNHHPGEHPPAFHPIANVLDNSTPT